MDSKALNIALNKGEGAPRLIIDRAVAIRAAVAQGDTAEAERLADEIERIQEAELIRTTGAPHSIPRDRDVWELCAERWAEYLIGAPMRTRFVYVLSGSTAVEALATARRVFFPTCVYQKIQPGDLFCVSRERRAAA